MGQVGDLVKVGGRYGKWFSYEAYTNSFGIVEQITYRVPEQRMVRGGGEHLIMVRCRWGTITILEEDAIPVPTVTNQEAVWCLQREGG